MIVAVLALAFVASQTCQKSQIRITKERAIATAERQVDFEPTREQVRLLRQGLNSKPFWIVSLSIPRRGQQESFRELAVVRIDANTGKVVELKVQR